MNFKFFFKKHFSQILTGGINIFFKKLISFLYLFLNLPIYVISIPIFIIIILIRPWYLIRWNKLYSNRIGHFAAYTELYCCERDANINFPRALIPIYAHAYNINCIDTPYLNLVDQKSFKAHLKISKSLGYTGILNIHPKQCKLTNINVQ